ncbi:hypothetical protein CF327_g7655 [Tilletia walkeri]|nr:hypothetical protein CF327_g7655 [Tilletia walkeri]
MLYVLHVFDTTRQALTTPGIEQTRTSNTFGSSPTSRHTGTVDVPTRSGDQPFRDFKLQQPAPAFTSFTQVPDDPSHPQHKPTTHPQCATTTHIQ